jgi:hypothetical protein
VGELGECFKFPGLWHSRSRQVMRANKKNRFSDDALGWIGSALALVAAIVLDKGSPPHKWHAAIMWTSVALFGVLIWGRNKRGSGLFWIYWSACLLVHVLAMWLIFGRLLPRLILGTVYVVPFAFIESILLTVAFFGLEHRLSAGGSR